MILIKSLMVAFFCMIFMHANAENSSSPLQGWYVGGTLAYVDFEGHYTNSRLPLTGNDYYFGADTIGGSLSIGYRFNEQWGLDVAFRDSGNLANSNAYDAFFSEMAFNPVYRWQPNSTFALNVKAGISLASYFVVLNRVVPWADDELNWTAIGLNAGVDLEWLLTDNISLTLGYDYVDARFKPQYDIAYNGSVFYPVPDINASLSRTAIGMRYTF